MSASTPPRAWERIVWPAAGLTAFVAVWHLAVRWSGTSVFPSPADVAAGLAELERRGVLWRYTGDSLRRVAAGYGLAACLGLPAGLLLGWWPAAAQIVNPIIQMARSISPIAWIPIAIVCFGVGEAAPISLVFLAAFFPIVVATMNGVRGVPAMYRRAALNFGLGSTRLLARVVLPAALPRVLVGLRIALGVAWLVIVAAEMIAVDSGLGYLVIDARNAGKRYDLVVAAMLLIGAIGLVLDLGFRRIERIRALEWGFSR
jgi:NitT/TauT family transport system permease protein